MAPLRPPFPPPPNVREEYDLTTPEEVARRRTRRRAAGWLGLLLLVAAAVWWGGKPAYRATRAWQARRIAGEARRATEAGHWNEAMGKVQDALALARFDPEVMRTTAVLLTRTGHGREALGFWKQVEKVRPLTMDDERDLCADLLAVDDVDGATATLHHVWPVGKEGTPADWRLALQLALRLRQNAEAIALSTRLVNAPGSSDQLRLDAAQVLVAANAPEVQSLGWDQVQKLSQGGSAISLQALLLLARQEAGRALAARKEHRTPDEPAAETLARQIENHPLAKAAQKLLAFDLRLAVDPGQHDELVKTAIARFSSGDDETLASLGAWLYAQGEFQRVLELIPPDRAKGSRALYLQYLDALGSMGRWADIKNAIEGQQFTLDPILEQMYLARCLGQLGQKEGSVLHWNAAVQAAGTNVDKLLTVGRYAERNGANEAAEAALRAAVHAAPDARPAQEGLLGLLQSQGRTRDAWDTLQGMLKVWPKDASVRNDVAYLGALLNEDVGNDRDTARELVRAEPSSLPHRVTLALAELRMGHALTALDALGGATLPVLATQGRYLAVDIAVLEAVGSYEPEIKAARQALDPSQLLPEERELIKDQH